jgi:hypothetical protein
VAADAFLNTLAQAADVLDGIVFHTADPAGDPAVSVADGGAEQAIATAAVAGAAGPTSAEPALPGRLWFSQVTVTTTDRITHVSLMSGGVWQFSEALRAPFGPGTFPFRYFFQASKS